jgi:hypothetical protein
MDRTPDVVTGEVYMEITGLTDTERSEMYRPARRGPVYRHSAMQRFTAKHLLVASCSEKHELSKGCLRD